MTGKRAPEEIKQRISMMIDSHLDGLFDQFDRLHKKDIHDDDVVTALRDLGETDLLDAYAEWADIDLRDPEERIPPGVVPDPGTNPSDLDMQAALGAKVHGQSPVGMIKELLKQLDHWEAQGDTTVGIGYLRRHFGTGK